MLNCIAHINTLKESGLKQIYYKKGDGLIGNDYEGTVDGVHPNDLGMMRMAEALQPAIEKTSQIRYSDYWLLTTEYCVLLTAYSQLPPSTRKHEW